MSPDKGAHRAIAVAMEAGLPLKIAGKCASRRSSEYFAEFVEPHLGGRIEYLGEVAHAEKVELLQHARVTLFPIEWEEPFGLVMIESMACGTPVIATRARRRPRGDRARPHRHHRRRLPLIPAALEAADRSIRASSRRVRRPAVLLPRRMARRLREGAPRPRPTALRMPETLEQLTNAYSVKGAFERAGRGAVVDALPP